MTTGDRRDEGRRVKSDETLFDIIELLGDRGAAGVTDVAETLDVAKSTAHAHLVSLRDRGYVVNDDGRYRIGLRFLGHGIHARAANPLFPMAADKVSHLAETTDERAWCQVEENGLAYYLCGAEGDHPVNPPVRVGECVPLHTISAGKAILAHLPAERVHEIVDRHGLAAETEQTITDETELFAELERIRERGYAFNEEESLPGLHAVGAPILDESDRIRGALSISGPANRLRGSKLRTEVPELLLGATNELEINLAYS